MMIRAPRRMLKPGKRGYPPIYCGRKIQHRWTVISINEASRLVEIGRWP